MAATKTFHLSTDAGSFVGWLTRYTRKASLPDVPTKIGTFSLQAAEVVAFSPGFCRVAMPGVYLYPQEDADFLYPVSEAIEFTVEALGPMRIKVGASCLQPAVEPYFRELLKAIAEDWPEERKPQGRPSRPTEPRGPTLKTRERAKLYKAFKDKHPEWSYARVAIEAGNKTGSTEHTGETVCNAYRAMGWKWERADRIR